MASSVIAWLSDFGTRDHYVGTMKGVALSIAPESPCVDITHDIEPFDVLGGALELAAACRFFPAGTVFVAVVDPGVGSSRRAIAVKAGGYQFVAPDNGVLALALRDLGPRSVVELSDARFALPVVSHTFEGRDRFAPAAAWLARGVAIDELGGEVLGMTELDVPEPRVTSDEIEGEVLRIDRFGNAITNISRPVLESWTSGAAVVITAGRTRLDQIVSTYAQASPGSLCALFGSSEHLEVAMAQGDAASRVGLARGSLVTVSKVSGARRASR